MGLIVICVLMRLKIVNKRCVLFERKNWSIVEYHLFEVMNINGYFVMNSL